MKKRYLIVLITFVLIAVFFLVYFMTLQNPLFNLGEPQNQENDNSTPSVLPFRMPWEAPTTTTNKSSGGGAGGAGGASGGNSGGSGGSGGGQENQGVYVPRVYYQVSADTVPEGLQILASYYVNGSLHFKISEAPFDLEADPGTFTCLLPASVVSNSTVDWTVDGQECQFSVCELSSSNRTGTAYSDHGCLVNMDTNHSIILQYTPNE